MCNHPRFACFSQHERSDFSTRALESKKISRYLTSIIAIIQLNYRDVFSAFSERVGKCFCTCLDINVLRWRFLSLNFAGKCMPFLPLESVAISWMIRSFEASKPRNDKCDETNIIGIALVP